MYDKRGVIVTQEVVDKLVKKEMLDPVNGKKLTEKDIIPIQRVNLDEFERLQIIIKNIQNIQK